MSGTLSLIWPSREVVLITTEQDLHNLRSLTEKAMNGGLSVAQFDNTKLRSPVRGSRTGLVFIRNGYKTRVKKKLWPDLIACIDRTLDGEDVEFAVEGFVILGAKANTTYRTSTLGQEDE